MATPTGIEGAADGGVSGEKGSGNSPSGPLGTARKVAGSKPSAGPSVPFDSRDAEPSDAELEGRIVAAELEGRRTVADALARQLEERRAARASHGVVVPIGRARRG